MMIKPWGRVWIAAMAALLVSLTGLEVALRNKGHEPSIKDNMSLWCLTRDEVEKADQSAIVLLGSSRILLDMDTRAMKELMPDRQVIQLGIAGTGPAATLMDLAGTTQFMGTVIVDITEPGFLRKCRKEQALYVTTYHERFTLNDRWHRRLQTFLEERLVFMGESVGLKQLGRSIVTRFALPEPYIIKTWPDRSGSAHFDRVDLPSYKRERMEGALHLLNRIQSPPETWLQEALELRDAVIAIERRGGRVFLVRFPSSGEYWDLEEERFPRVLYWDVLAQTMPGRMVHFRDVRSLTGIECPDGSHLDAKDASDFTRNLLFELGLLSGGEVDAGKVF